MDFVNNDTEQLPKLIRCQSDLSGYHSNVYRLHRGNGKAH